MRYTCADFGDHPCGFCAGNERERRLLLILAGDSFAPFRPHLQRLNLDHRVIVRERVQEVEDYLQVATLTATASASESFCLSVLEGMMFAVPGVATRVGGIPEVLTDGAHGLLVDEGDAEALAAAMARLLANPAERLAMGRAAAERARSEFSAHTIVDQYEDVYRRALGLTTAASVSAK